MDDWKLPWHGGCLCGGIRFRISVPPFLTMACHCTASHSFATQPDLEGYTPLIEAFAREGADRADRLRMRD